MQLIAATLIILLTGLLGPDTAPAPDEISAWDRLHVSSQRYLEKNAKFYCLDDSGRLWNRKIYMEDESSLPRMSKSAREIRLSARNDLDAPAWFCIDANIQICPLPEFRWLVEEALNQSALSKRRDLIRQSGAGIFLYFRIYEAVDHGEVRGTLYRLGGEEIDAVMIDLPQWNDAEYGDVFPIRYPLLIFDRSYIDGYWYNGKYFTHALPRYKINVDSDLDSAYPIYKPTVSNFPPLTPQELAQEIANRKLTSLPEWRSRWIPNPAYAEWKKATRKKNGSLFYDTPQGEPPKRIVTWTKKPHKLRFID